MNMHRHEYRPQQAPELYGDQWFNSSPLSLGSMLGRNILLFFWNNTSPASLRMLPTVKEWFDAYAGLGLVCIGIHTPEFSFDTDARAVQQLLRKRGIQFPVVSDNERLIAEAYRVSEFPAIVLIGSNGQIYDVVTQMFSAMRLERSIQYLLRQSGFFGELPMLRTIEREQTLTHRASELTTGYFHGSLGNPEGYSPELNAEYRDPLLYVEGKFYAHGIWCAEKNAIRYAGNPNEGFLICTTTGEHVDILVGCDTKASVRILVDDASMPLEQMGTDVQRDARGISIVTAGEPQFLSVFRGTDTLRHAVKFFPSHAGCTFYKFSFYRERMNDGENPFVGKN